jgi:hypothetical protein
MTWTGTWRNQYGSELTILDERDGRITGTFRTALRDSSFFGRELAVSGIVRGTCINFSFGDAGASADTIASFTGMRLGEVIETMWFVVSHVQDKAEPWPHAVATNHDTFTRI